MEVFLEVYYPWLLALSSLSSAIPVVGGVLLLNKRSSLLFWLVFSYSILIALAEFAAELTAYLGTNNNLWIDHLYTPLEFALLAVIYYISFSRKLFKRGVVVAAVGFVLYSVLNSMLGQEVTQMNSVPHVIESVLLISLAVLYFYQTVHSFAYIYLDRDPVFVLSCCLLIYQAGTSMSYAMFNRALADSYDTARMCITVILVLNILFRIGLLLVLRRTRVA
ncbi:hypothetical protein [Pontibacter akesuensis]|uniref:Uncharacterized protein n=1 Tax=Pontibacter akesuensis TaxID=388950 RepID=A0A1I7H1E4_9BACT|nr:hypothetical protein [Pontibacter akesuensis]GHA54099.1 hypothetical protein GCM10007389_01690 [Pontibacter akesuensis]SFU54306.1 hypothetical protein SAMN04487941_1410 [Pontibacter akesuensis]